MEHRLIKLYSKSHTVPLKVLPGHFATNHSHVNFYIDITTLKTRVSEAEEVARTLAGKYMMNTVVDTIVCLDGTQVIGALVGAGADAQRPCFHECPQHHLCSNA